MRTRIEILKNIPDDPEDFEGYLNEIISEFEELLEELVGCADELSSRISTEYRKI